MIRFNEWLRTILLNEKEPLNGSFRLLKWDWELISQFQVNIKFRSTCIWEATKAPRDLDLDVFLLLKNFC